MYTLDLSSLKQEIREHYKGNTSVYGRWLKGKKVNGKSIDEVASELREAGMNIPEGTTAETLFYLDKLYLGVVQTINPKGRLSYENILTDAEKANYKETP